MEDGGLNNGHVSRGGTNTLVSKKHLKLDGFTGQHGWPCYHSGWGLWPRMAGAQAPWQKGSLFPVWLQNSMCFFREVAVLSGGQPYLLKGWSVIAHDLTVWLEKSKSFCFFAGNLVFWQAGCCRLTRLRQDTWDPACAVTGACSSNTWPRDWRCPAADSETLWAPPQSRDFTMGSPEWGGWAKKTFWTLQVLFKAEFVWEFTARSQTPRVHRHVPSCSHKKKLAWIGPFHHFHPFYRCIIYPCLDPLHCRAADSSCTPGLWLRSHYWSHRAQWLPECDLDTFETGENRCEQKNMTWNEETTIINH